MDLWVDHARQQQFTGSINGFACFGRDAGIDAANPAVFTGDIPCEGAAVRSGNAGIANE
jgi:hypothetical protein